MDSSYRVREALNAPSNDDIDTTAYSPTISETNLALLGSHIQIVRVEVWSYDGLQEAIDALSAADVHITRIVDGEALTPPTDALAAIDIPVPPLEDQPIVFEFPEAYDHEPTEVAWDTFYYPATEVRLQPRNRRANTPTPNRRTVSQKSDFDTYSSALYGVEFTDTKGNDHQLTHNFGHPERDEGSERRVRFDKLEEVIDALRMHGVSERVVRFLDL